jgi:threonine synthase
MTDDGPSLATGQRSMADPDLTYPLWPPLTQGCPETSTDDVQYPLEVTYDYDAVDTALFERPPEPGLERWAPLLPPLADGLAAGEGATPLVETPALVEWAGLDGPLYVKDESANPTWSQKDRLNRLTVSAAVEVGAEGVVASSSGNHGAAAAAYAARAGLPCVVVTSPDTPGAMQAFLRSYGAAVVAVEGWDERAEVVDRLADDHEFHPVTSRTTVHTGHPFGPEGYKTIAYEIHHQLGGAVPGTVLVPTAHAELLYGVWKGFRELETLGVASGHPRMVACEPAARGPLRAAIERDEQHAEVEAAPTAAHSIGATRSSLRGRRAVEESDGTALGVSEDGLAEARERMARAGLWQETSGAAGVAGVRAAVEEGLALPSPVVALATSSGFKDGDDWTAPVVEGDWPTVREALETEYGLTL